MRKHSFCLMLSLILAIQWSLLAGEFPPARVNVANVTKTRLSPTAWVAGDVVSPNNSKIASEVSGRLEWLAELGSRVKQGDKIATIDDSRLQLRLNEARAAVQSQESKYHYFQSEVERIKSLAGRNLSSITDLDKVIRDRDVALNELSEARSRLQQIQKDIDFSVLRAPFDGLVTQRLSNVGEYVQSGVGIIQLVETTNTEISIFAPITSYPFLNQGQMLDVDSPMGQMRAPVKSIIPVAQSRTHLMEVRLDVSASNWPVGLKVKVAVPNAESKEVIAIPRDALVLRRDSIHVFRITGEVAEQVTIQVGIGQGQLVEVIGPLSVGEQVVVRGAERLQSGQKVSIMTSNDHLVSGNP